MHFTLSSCTLYSCVLSTTGVPDEFDTTPDPESDPDGLNELKKKIELLGQGTEERKVAVAEWKRLKRIPSASAEWGVVRGYVSLTLIHVNSNTHH